MKAVAFVPMKLNNERMPGKNTKPFDSGEPLFHFILKALLQVAGVDEIYVYCSSPEIADQLPDGVRYLSRDTRLDRSDTPINDVMMAFAEDIPADVYVLAHATAPFLTPASIERAVGDVRSGSHDSALTVVRLREFLWQHDRPANYDPSFIPRTQDLEPMYAETTGLYVYERSLIAEHGRRIGLTPSLVEVSKIEAIDINDPVDFVIANAVYTHASGQPAPGEAS